MGFDAWLTLLAVAAVLVALLKNLGPPDLLFLGGTSLLALAGVISPAKAYAGFSNSGMLTVAALFVITAALRETGILHVVGNYLLGAAKTEAAALRRLAAAVLPMSALLNNTPIVAMCLPMVHEWCRRNEVSPSKLMIPLSYLAILGGTCTLIGTSTNLVVHGMMIEHGIPGMTMFEISAVGIPYALVGLLYLLTIGRRLLPDRQDLLERLGESRREYLLEMKVETNCRLANLSVASAGLRNLPGLFLIEIERDGVSIAPVAPDDVILANDRLVFAGVVSSIIELKNISGLLPVADPHFELEPNDKRKRRLCEAVISRSSPLIGKTIREADFRAAYGASVLAVHRSGERIRGKIGEIKLRHGDTLLLQTGPNFARAHRNDPGFYLVSAVEGWRPLRDDRAWLSFTLFVLLIAAMVSGVVDIVTAAMTTAFLLVAGRCISAGDARRSIEWPVLITIASSFGLGAALLESGAAGAIAGTLVDLSRPFGPIGVMVCIYVATWVLTELITNNAAAVLMFPFSIEAARLMGVSERPFLMALVLAASASFSTPIGYQTNMMVYGPGGYRFSDFVRVGLPLSLLLLVVSMTLIPIVWPF